MSLPGNRIPPENLPPGGSSTPAADADMPPVFCRHSVRFSWVPDEGGYICDDPEHHSGDAAAQSGAIDLEHQPHFRYPPNEAQRLALARDDLLAEKEAIADRLRDRLRGF